MIPREYLHCHHTASANEQATCSSVYAEYWHIITLQLLLHYFAHSFQIQELLYSNKSTCKWLSPRYSCFKSVLNVMVNWQDLPTGKHWSGNSANWMLANQPITLSITSVNTLNNLQIMNTLHSLLHLLTCVIVQLYIKLFSHHSKMAAGRFSKVISCAW